MFKTIDSLAKNHDVSDEKLLEIIKNTDDAVLKHLCTKADEVRKGVYSNEVYIRGLIEISNICKNDCFYCGIRKSNQNCERYRLSQEDILNCVDEGYILGFRTFVLQGAEDDYYTDKRLCEIIKTIKNRYPDCCVTLSLGERNKESYKALFKAGAERYLLRHETATRTHYRQLHPAVMSFDNRIKCLCELKEIGYQTGCGFMVGSPFQTPENLVADLRFIKTFNPDMCGIGPYIPHSETPFKDKPQGSLELTIKMLAITRLLVPDVLLPATTALATISEYGQIMGIQAGANVVMPNLSPMGARQKYELYNKKLFEGSQSAQEIKELEKNIKLAGYQLVYTRGDNIKFRNGDGKCTM